MDGRFTRSLFHRVMSLNFIDNVSQLFYTFLKGVARGGGVLGGP